METRALEHEWQTLQNQFDSYEKFSLLIKLANISVLCAAYFSHHLTTFVVWPLLVLWLQDAIWKTFQSRIETRLLHVEGMLAAQKDGRELSPANTAYQFNSDYQTCRPGTAGLIKEYVRQALRPTIAFPHIVLLLILGFELLTAG